MFYLEMKIYIRIIFSYLILLLLFLFPSKTFAATYFDTPIPSGENYTVVSNNFCSGPDVCANSQNIGNCDLPNCDGGTDWTKYQLICVQVRNPVLGTVRYDEYYERGDVIYSIGDKCTSGGPYLDPGYCTTPYGGPIYKTCCSNTGNEISPYACVPINNLDNAGDIEGRCPAGYEREEFCGFNGIPCGQEACGPIVP